jgi:hypothetical protein
VRPLEKIKYGLIILNPNKLMMDGEKIVFLLIILPLIFIIFYDNDKESRGSDKDT